MTEVTVAETSSTEALPALVDQAIEFVLKLEDASMDGVITLIKGDRGGATRFGITQRWHPELTPTGFFDFSSDPNAPHGQVPKMEMDEALKIAKGVLSNHYAKPLRLASFQSLDVAERILSFAVNEGTTEAVAILQRAVNAVVEPPDVTDPQGNKISIPLTVDGAIGPNTIHAANVADASLLVDSLRGFAASFYKLVVARNQSQAPFLKGWLNRANA
jgi:lysozyme family protein